MTFGKYMMRGAFLAIFMAFAHMPPSWADTETKQTAGTAKAPEDRKMATSPVVTVEPLSLPDLPLPAGLYKAIAGPETASFLLLLPDGEFRFMLSVGALDTGALGKWQKIDDTRFTLTTIPRPKAPELRPESMTKKTGAPISIHITTPKGRGVAGVDFIIGFGTGEDDRSETIAGYTQSDGWKSAPTEKRQPRWITLREPIHDIVLDKMPIPDGANDLRFTLIPNDIGVMDFNTVTGQLDEGDGETYLTLKMAEGSLRFVRIKTGAQEEGDNRP